MPEIRMCPACGELQEWCDQAACAWPIPRGHWTHLTDSNCIQSGDRNPDPAGPPDFTWQEAFNA